MRAKLRVLVSGAGGFIGRAVCEALTSHGVAVNRCVRSASANSDAFAVGEVGPDTDWAAALRGCDEVLHLAGRAHQLDDTASNVLELFERVNVQGSLRLLNQAAQQGIKRFVFVSSIGVNGNRSTRPYLESDAEDPQEPYARSKWEAEQKLKELAGQLEIELVIVRPPLVYGPNAPGNFGRLLRIVAMPVPLPFAAIDNRRSLIGIDNLVDFLMLCLRHPRAANQTFLVSDGKDVSTSDLIRAMRAAAGRPARLFPVPVRLLAALAAWTGKGALWDRLSGNLQADISYARELLDWTPPATLEQGLRKAVQAGPAS